MVAFLGFRGQRSSGSPIELFPGHGAADESACTGAAPDFSRMAAGFARRSRARCRSATKCRSRTAQAAPGTSPLPTGSEMQPHGRVQRRDRLLQHRQDGDELGNGNSVAGDERVDGARRTAVQHQLRGLSRRGRDGQRNHQSSMASQRW